MSGKSPAVRVALDCLGCKLNQAELEIMARQLAGAGYEVVGAEEPADIYILNTCTVTHIADRKARNRLRQARRRNPAVRLVATGCYAERAPQDLAGIEGVELVAGNAQKAEIVSLLGVPPQGVPYDGIMPPDAGRRTRAFIKVQDGCRSYCAYCIVPLVRSSLSCVPAGEVVAEVNEHVAAGYREVVLTGTEIGDYHEGVTELSGLLQRILAETRITRLRLSSLQPQHITGELVNLWQDERLCPHFHLSLQSGSDGVLARMRRRYNTAQYSRAVAMIREALPDAAVTTDIITGFPGETDAEFFESYEFCEKAGFARIHVFPYSPRPGTVAIKLPGRVADAVKRERTRRMLALAEQSAARFKEGFLDRVMTVLWERQAGGYWSGLTGNYIKVYIKSSGNLVNDIGTVRLAGLYRDGMFGELC